MLYSDFIGEGEICDIIQKEISPLIKDTDFEDMYKTGGRPPVSPRVLLLTTLLQYLERLPDRSAANNLKYRLDWKIAFGLPLEFAGIHHTTLVYFRNRLLEHEKSSYAFDKILEHLVSLKLIKKRGKQRIDSTHIIANVKELSRVELLHETLRMFCKEVEPFKDELDDKLLKFVEFYSDKMSIRGISAPQKDKYIKDAATAMMGFIQWGKKKSISSSEVYSTLCTVFEQNFKIDPDPNTPPKLVKVSTGKDHICSPHETNARYSSKGNKGWLGYKAQIAETIPRDKNDVGFITYIDLNDSTTHDGESVKPMIEKSKCTKTIPATLYADTHYNTSDNIENLQEEGVDLRGPVMPVSSKHKTKNKGFKIDIINKKVICPEGVESKRFNAERIELLSASFPKVACQQCPKKTTCEPEPRGKIFTARPENPILITRREEMTTDKFKKEMHQRNGIEGTISGLVRGQHMRRSRFKNKAKTMLQIKFVGAAANLKRLQRKRIIEGSTQAPSIAA